MALIYKTKLIEASQLHKLEDQITQFLNTNEDPAFKTALELKEIMVNVARSDKFKDTPAYIASVIWKDIL